MMRPLAVALLACAALTAPATARADEKPAAVCARVLNDNENRPLPADMGEPARLLFEDDIRQEFVPRAIWRCMDGKAWVCFPGGERHCGRADSQVMATPEADAYCKANPNHGHVPRHATGKDTIFKWVCRGTRAKPDHAVRTVDPRGFVAEYWRRLD